MTDVPVREVPAGATYWSVFRAVHGATSFNPNVRPAETALEAGGGRFHPFEDRSGARVPTKYVADHENGALAETLLRSVPGERQVSVEAIREHRLARLALRRAPRLVDLTALDLESVTARFLGQDERAYPALRRTAATLHARDPGLDGIVWEGRQLGQPGMKCLVLFGDRVAADADLEAIEILPLDAGVGLRTLRAAARLREYALPKVLGLTDR